MKSLSDLDRAYRKFVSVASSTQRLDYCNGLIRRTEKFVTNEGPHLSKYKKQRSFALIIAAEEEMKKLS